MRHIANGFWHGATGHASRILIPCLVQRGVLNAGNFLPVSTLQLNLHRRRGPLKHMVLDYPEIVRDPQIGLPDGIAQIETAIWDWAPLLRSVSLAAAKRNGTIAQARKFVMAAPGDDEPERASLLAVFDAYEGNPEAAWERLTELAAANPEHAMTWQRLSHAYWLGRKFGKAVEAAEQAAALGKGVPMLQAWCGMVLIRTRKHRRAARLLARADAAETGFPIIPALLAQALDAEDAPEEALAAVDRALVLAPMDGEFTMQRAALLDRLDRLPEAVAGLERMVELYRAPGKMFRTIVDMLTRMGETDRAEAMVRLCQERYPDHPITRRMVEDHAA